MLNESGALFLSGMSLTFRAVILLVAVCVLCPFFLLQPGLAYKLEIYADDLLEECAMLKARQKQLERKRQGN